MDLATIVEVCKLPSKGKIYDKDIPEKVSIRSMTVAEELKRQSFSERSYKVYCDIIDDCIQEKLPMSCYDMHIGDYQQLLYTLRVATYGNEYKVESICPHCGHKSVKTIDLDSFEVQFYDETKDNSNELTLPRSKKIIKLKYQTPRDLDDIEEDIKDFNKRHPESTLNVSLLMTLKHCILTIDGNRLDGIKLEAFIRQLPMMDTNEILKKIYEINNRIGVNSNSTLTCTNPECRKEYISPFRLTSEFFGPTL